MEDKMADFYLQFQEIRSCIIILQKALDNESEELEISDISNYLTLALDKINNAIEIYGEFRNIEL